MRQLCALEQVRQELHRIDAQHRCVVEAARRLVLLAQRRDLVRHELADLLPDLEA